MWKAIIIGIVVIAVVLTVSGAVAKGALNDIKDVFRKDKDKK